MSEAFPKGSTEEHVHDIEAFITKYKGEILVILDDPEERSFVERVAQEGMALLSPNDEERLASILERFETKLFTYEKQDADQEGKRVLVTSDNPGAWSAIKPLIKALNEDNRCQGISAIVSGMAGKDFQKSFPSFERVRTEETVLGDALALAEREPIDITLSSVSVKNGPEDLALFGGKSNLGATKNYLVFEGYGGVGGAFNLDTRAQMEQIDGIFCNDIFAKALVHKLLPAYPVDHIYATGLLASEGFELPKAAAYRTEIRAQLGIADDAFTVLYLGDVSLDYENMPGADPNINTKTFEKTLAGLEVLARMEKESEIALIVRPHPRDPDKEKLANVRENEVLPENLSVKNGSNPIPFNGVIYAADAVVSIMSTENFFAPARGRRSVFLAYDEPGLGGQALQNAYGPELIAALRQMPGVFIASSPAELAEILEHLSKEPLPEPAGTSTAVSGILDTIFT